MAEQQTKKKKLGKIRQILRWIGLMMLVWLVVLAFIFEAPWRVIILPIIFLVACIILPRPVRKWFWVSVGVLIVVLAIWVFLPERGEWKPYKHDFQKELTALNDKYAIPDKENAALIYNELLGNHESGGFVPSLSDPNICNIDFSKPWLSEDYPELAQWLKGQERTIVAISEAAKIEKCQFQIEEDSIRQVFGPSQRKHLEAMMSMACLLVCAANNDLAERHDEKALAKHIMLLRISEHLRQQPITVDMLTGIDCQVIALNQIRGFLVSSNPAESHLAVVEDAIMGIKHDWKASWERIVEFEKLGVMKDLLWMLYETNTEGKIRITVVDLFRCSKPISQQGLPHWNIRRAKAGSILTWFFLPHTPKEAVKIIDKTLVRYGSVEYLNSQLRLAPDFSVNSPLKFNFSYVINLFVDNYMYSVYHRFLRLKSDAQATRIIIALRRYKNMHGRWPKVLDEVKEFTDAQIFVDPVNGGSYVYRLNEENFVLYSKGENNIDENLKYKSGADDRSFWPI